MNALIANRTIVHLYILWYNVVMTTKERSQQLRALGKTYSEINSALGMNVPKSTLATWCKSVPLPMSYYRRKKKIILENIKKARLKAVAKNKETRAEYFLELTRRNKHLKNLLKNKDAAKIVLATLYLCEGSKQTKGALAFGNSDPMIVDIFVSLLRHVFEIDEKKFRCTLQCRADQNIKELGKFWSETTKIPLTQFYKARIDPRTIGKPSIKKDYKGVLRIDYFSAAVYNELTVIAKILGNPLV